ncbi:MAG TPA: BamA/TamA family outer membrane protein [bacterium]|nr:BamA/TamA family outer membrane protein [bacterium]
MTAAAWAATGNSYAPILGYDDKNGLLYGAAAFHYHPDDQGLDCGAYGVTNGGSLDSLTLQSEDQGPAWSCSADLRLARTFDNYYGEGDATPAADPLRIDENAADLDGAALRRVNGRLALGPTLGYRVRRQTGLSQADGAAAPARVFNDEASPALGLRALYDSRDNAQSTRRGSLLGLDLRSLPAALAAGGDGSDAWQAEAQWRSFQPLPAGCVLGQRLAGGASLGDPSYAERYSLGGTDELRGFQDNRFRGRQYYCLQEELRAPLYRQLSGAAGVDLGDVNDNALGAPRRSVQAGLRLGLPPSYGMKARVDLGFADSGERSLAVQFGESF